MKCLHYVIHSKSGNVLQRFLRREYIVRMDDASVVDPCKDHVAVDHAAVLRDAEAGPTFTGIKV